MNGCIIYYIDFFVLEVSQIMGIVLNDFIGYVNEFVIENFQFGVSRIKNSKVFNRK